MQESKTVKIAKCIYSFGMIIHTMSHFSRSKDDDNEEFFYMHAQCTHKFYNGAINF